MSVCDSRGILIAETCGKIRACGAEFSGPPCRGAELGRVPVRGRDSFFVPKQLTSPHLFFSLFFYFFIFCFYLFFPYLYGRFSLKKMNFLNSAILVKIHDFQPKSCVSAEMVWNLGWKIVAWISFLCHGRNGNLWQIQMKLY